MVVTPMTMMTVMPPTAPFATGMGFNDTHLCRGFYRGWLRDGHGS